MNWLWPEAGVHHEAYHLLQNRQACARQQNVRAPLVRCRRCSNRWWCWRRIRGLGRRPFLRSWHGWLFVVYEACNLNLLDHIIDEHIDLLLFFFWHLGGDGKSSWINDEEFFIGQGNCIILNFYRRTNDIDWSKIRGLINDLWFDYLIVLDTYSTTLEALMLERRGTRSLHLPISFLWGPR